MSTASKAQEFLAAVRQLMDEYGVTLIDTSYDGEMYVADREGNRLTGYVDDDISAEPYIDHSYGPQQERKAPSSHVVLFSPFQELLNNSYRSALAEQLNCASPLVGMMKKGGMKRV